MGTVVVRHAPRGRALGLGHRRLAALAAAFSLSAALAHLGVASAHWREWWAHGAFFVVTGVLQTALAALLWWRPRAWVALAGIAGNLAIICMYVYSRTNGPPVGPHEGVPESPGVSDMSTTAGEFVLIVLLVLMLDGRARRWATNLVLVVALGLWAGNATGFLV